MRVGTGVGLSLRREQLQVLLADFAVIQVLLLDVVPRLLKAALHVPVTDGAANVEQSSQSSLQSAVLEANAILSVPWKAFQRSQSSKRLDLDAHNRILFTTSFALLLESGG